MSRLRFAAWKAWNRTRYYWPQAQARRRAIATLRAGVERDGSIDWATFCADVGMRRRPWWIP